MVINMVLAWQVLGEIVTTSKLTSILTIFFGSLIVICFANYEDPNYSSDVSIFNFRCFES